MDKSENNILEYVFVSDTDLHCSFVFRSPKLDFNFPLHSSVIYI